ncbi:hypothetical protein [Streptomyces wuyuanensis]|uniref:hypothetical protein n=1 Tax=Streptomyces wuyuanensis TaxID=1196353 RepID=UPI00341C8B1F
MVYSGGVWSGTDECALATFVDQAAQGAYEPGLSHLQAFLDNWFGPGRHDALEWLSRAGVQSQLGYGTPAAHMRPEDWLVDICRPGWSDTDEEALVEFVHQTAQGVYAPGLDHLWAFLDNWFGPGRHDALEWLSRAGVHSQLAHDTSAAHMRPEDWLVHLCHTWASAQVSIPRQSSSASGTAAAEDWRAV